MKKRANGFARFFIFVYVNKYKRNIFPVVTNMTKIKYSISQKGQKLCSTFHKVSMVSTVRISIIKSVKNKRNRLHDQLGGLP